MTETWYYYVTNLQGDVVRYVIEAKVYDYYNFNKGNEVGDGWGSDLNNIGYGLHEMGLGKDYHWTVSFSYATRWKVCV